MSTAGKPGCIGFANLKGTVTVAGRNVQQDLALEVGSLEETISIRAKAGAQAQVAETRAKPECRKRRRDPPGAEREERLCQNDPMGGNIKAPRQACRRAAPISRRSERAGIGGVVVLDARIGTDGDVVDVSVREVGASGARRLCGRGRPAVAVHVDAAQL